MAISQINQKENEMTDHCSENKTSVLWDIFSLGDGTKCQLTSDGIQFSKNGKVIVIPADKLFDRIWEGTYVHYTRYAPLPLNEDPKTRRWLWRDATGALSRGFYTDDERRAFCPEFDKKLEWSEELF